jgi:GntR family transcriptional repressor for pyruvate dehydrogenase complex
MEITPIKKVNAVDQVFDQICRLLINNTWKSGDKLPSESELADTFMVSRITIRQVLQKLKALGMIETHNGSGSYVRQVSPADSLQDLMPLMYIGQTSQLHIFQFREVIEAESARIAAPLAAEKELLILSGITDDMRMDAGRDSIHDFAEDDLKFHSRIVEMTENPLLIKAYTILLPVLEESMKSVVEKMRFAGLEYHVRILQAMKDHNAALAESLMREHIHKNYNYFPRDSKIHLQ